MRIKSFIRLVVIAVVVTSFFYIYFKNNILTGVLGNRYPELPEDINPELKPLIELMRKNREFKFGKISEKNLDYLLSLKAPTEVVDFYKANEPDYVQVNDIYLHSVDSIRLSIEELTTGSVMIQKGYIPIATNGYGDEYGISIDDNKVYYFNHEITVDDAVEELINIRRLVSNSYIEFLYGFINGEIKEDYYFDWDGF